MRDTHEERVPLYRQIRDYIQDGIARGVWAVGEALPSENELAGQFNVSRLTIKHALESLVDGGAIYRIQGKGTFVSDGAGGEPSRYQGQPREASENPPAESRRGPELIGYLLPRLNNMFMANILSGIERKAAEKGFRLLVGMTHDSQEAENKILQEMIDIGVSGILVYPVEGELYSETILRLILDRFPLVMIDRYLRGIETNCVCSDNMLAGKQATRRLVELGHRRIAFVSHSYHGTSSVEDRLSGYEAALAEAGIPKNPDLRLLNLKTLSDSNVQEIRSFLSSGKEISAVIAVNSAIGTQVITAAKELGLRIPQDLSVIVFDNYDTLPFIPTHVKQKEDDLAAEGVDLLLAAIRNPDSKRRRIELPTTLIEGSTTAKIPHGGSG